MTFWRERWQSRYGETAWLFGRAPNLYLRSLDARLPRRGRALSLGEGEGRNAVWLAARGLAVTAVDFAPLALARVRALAAESGLAVETIEADVSRWQPQAAAFDVVTLIFLQVSPDERVPAHRAAREALAPGGLLVLEAFAKGERGACGPKTDESRYDAAMLREDFAGLEILELLSGTVALEEGGGHCGSARVVRLFARRG
jgi:SAM-dependent methyltransferase